MTDLSIIGYAALITGVVMPLAITFHLVRMYREKSSKGQSATSPTIMTLGAIVWVLYGIEQEDLVVFVTNIFWTVLQAIYIGFILYYRKKNHG